MVAAFDSTNDHRWSIIFVGGPESGADEIGDTHPTNVDQGGLADGYASWMRSNLWVRFPAPRDLTRGANPLGSLWTGHK